MTAEIIRFNGTTTLPLEPDQVLEAAKGKLQGVLVIGFTNDDKFWASSSTSDLAECLWMIEKCKLKIFGIEGWEEK